MKQKLYNIFEKEGSRANLVFERILVTMIILNVISIAVDTIRNLQTEIVFALKVFESFSIVVFSAEYLIRLYLADLTHPAVTQFRSRLRFIFSFFGLIDLLAILPFYLPFVIRADMRFLRILRLIRFFRIFKLSRYNSTLQLIWDVIKEKKSEFIMTFFISFLMLLVSAFLMYYIESPGQPENFRNIFSSLWWAVATLTPLGYGGVEPVTTAGKVMSAIVAVIGIGLIALPTGIISAGFIQKIKTMDAIDKKEGDKTKTTAGTVCPHCGKEIESN
jgi:voltage-gated potassium channel